MENNKPKTKIKVLTESKTESGLAISYADIFSFDFLPDNIKAHNSEGIENSIYTFGFVEPILVNKNTNRDISGNGRLKTLRRMFEEGKKCPTGIIEKMQKVTDIIFSKENEFKKKRWYAPVVLLDIPEEDEAVLAARLNRENEKGGIDPQKAYEVLMRIRAQSESKFVSTGFDNSALEHIQMLAKFRNQLSDMKDNDAENEKTDEQIKTEKAETEDLAKRLNREKWKVEYGDLWQAGRHRIICHDSRAPGAYERLLEGNPFRLVITSPPYDNQRIYELEEKINWTELMNDVSLQLFNIGRSNWSAKELPSEIVINLGPVYRDAEVIFYWNEWLDFCKKELKSPLYGLYIWDKMTGIAGEWNGRLAPCHEFFFHFSFGRKSANKWIEKTDASIKRGPVKVGLRNKDGGFGRLSSPEKLEQPFKVPDSVFRHQKEQARGIHTEGHPAVYPVGLPFFAIKTWSMIGDIVVDPFAGSGTTLIACEQTDRLFRGIDISPNYVALILERYQKEFPGQEIKKI